MERLTTKNRNGVSILDRIDASGDCWEWDGAHTDGYGKVWSPSDDRLVYVHRIMWEGLVGPIPEGLEIDHLCRNTGCSNPDHLEPVTRRENIRRGIGADVARRRMRAKTHCPQGHPYSEENTYRYGRSRRCRACNRDAQRRYAERRVA